MDVKVIQALLDLVKSKHLIDEENTWSDGSATYFDELKKELDEVEDELILDRSCYLEDELGDVFWDYLNLLHNLDQEGKIKLEKVFDRALQEFSERLGEIKNGSAMDNMKQGQKQRVATEYQEILSDGESIERKSNKAIK